MWPIYPSWERSSSVCSWGHYRETFNELSPKECDGAKAAHQTSRDPVPSEAHATDGKALPTSANRTRAKQESSISLHGNDPHEPISPNKKDGKRSVYHSVI